jgi:hypothetical protein
MTQEQLLAQVEEALRTMPPLPVFQHQEEDVTPWIGHALAVIEAWSTPHAIPDTLIAALRQQGATATAGEVLPFALPCLSTKGRVVFVNTGTINVYEYPTAAAAEADAVRVSPDGSGVAGDQCAALITWVGPPHFYKTGQLIVVYAGSAADVLRPLEAVLGKPFANR